ncbi:hypothetical protein CGCA056_v003912 [Colletotrichum aenigma]|uniref:uncharacterized protein n=1 Tax=Colletotrichum aenigma TaxID=1215731 RepID=UPI001872A809|nr:uncharacterized protein CGCA056_v003912 [Colletotrichum aenigma]KAF5525741.1 hypothetical protein CGCA056_v003912 [Colletotrichum aenigma]
MAPQDEKLCFDLEFRYFLAAKDIPAHVACLWQYFSLAKCRKGLESWVVSVPAAKHASNAEGSDRIQLLRFAIRFTHKTATYADIDEARVIFKNAFNTAALHVGRMSNAPARQRGLLEYNKLLRFYVTVRNHDSWSWGNWGLSSYYYNGTTPDDDSAISAMERFKQKYQEAVPYSVTPETPTRTSFAASELLVQASGAEKRLRKLVPSLNHRHDVDFFNDRVRWVIEGHASILACATEAHSNAQMASDSAAEVTKFSNPKEKSAILNRSMWEKFASLFDRDHNNKYTEATAKLNDRAISLQEDAKAMQALVTQVNAQLAQHACACRLLTLHANTKIEHGQLLSIWERPDADKKLLVSLFGADIKQMEAPTGRFSQLCNEMERFEVGQRALRKGEKRLLKGLKKMEGKLERLNKDSVKARNKFAAGQLRAQKGKLSGKVSDLESDTDSAYSYDEKM